MGTNDVQGDWCQPYALSEVEPGNALDGGLFRDL